MAATSAFITTISPIDGVVLTDSNCCYVDSTNGSDSNSGIRLNPKATITSAATIGKTYILFRGVSTENVSSSGIVNLIFDNASSRVIGTLQLIKNTSYVTLYAVNASTFIPTNGNAIGIKVLNCIFDTINGASNYAYSGFISNTYIKNYNLNIIPGSVLQNMTIDNFKSYSNGVVTISDTILNLTIDLYNFYSLTTGYYTSFNNTILRKALIWKWNGIIIPITYTAATGVLSADSAQWKTDIYNSLTTYYNTLATSTSKTYLASILSNWSIIFPSTTMVVDDINCCPIFNLYSSEAPIDYSLKISNTNPALTMSSVGSYIGAYKASITPTYDLTTLKELDSNGNETANTPDILVLGSNRSLYPSPSATQYRNRVKTNLVSYPRGYSFDGVQSLLTSGLSARYGYGKFQTYTTVYTPQESVEIEPRNADGSASSFPNFSAKLNGQTQMWYHQYGTGTVAITTGGVITGTGTSFLTQFVVGQPFYVGNESHVVTSITSNTVMNVASWSVAVAAGSKYASVPTAKINTPVLFSDLATYYAISSDLNLTEYGAWAVTNADYDSYYLNQKTGVQLTTIYLFNFKFIVNINYYV